MFPIRNARKLGGVPAAQVLRYATVAITAAQIKGLSAAAVTLVPAQGAGTLIEMVSLLFNCAAGTLYAAGGGGAAVFVVGASSSLPQWTDGSSGLRFALSNSVGATWTVLAVPALSGSAFASGALIDSAGAEQNQPMQLFQTGGATKDLVTGTGTLTVRVCYRVHSGLS